ncbi:MAG: Gp49 family protein [Pseudomonas sp.]
MADFKESAPRITIQDIEANIADEVYFTAADGYEGATGQNRYGRMNSLPLSLLTFCVLVLRNGFTVTGEAACVSPENFNAELGRKIAREKAVEKIWPLMGYELKTKLSEAPVENEKPPIGGPLILCHGCEGDCDCVCG